MKRNIFHGVFPTENCVILLRKQFLFISIFKGDFYIR